MPDALYDHPRLAPVYDAFEPDRRDLDAYVDLARERGARRIVDLGCGTGVLALRLAGPRRHVTGVDPAAGSLRVARSKPGADAVGWVHGDARAIPPGSDVDLVTMTGNAAQAVLTDDGWAAMLRHVRAALHPDGCFVFETRRPQARAWERRAGDGVETAEVAGIGRVQRRHRLTTVDLPLVTFTYTYRFSADGTTLTSESTIRFRERDEIERTLQDAGLGVHEIRDAPDRPGLEFVVLAVPRGG
ncbi:class I SAM-dependent DNA methyltransferase [Pseudonocardia sp. HH130630-07]|uniref:class I SAM-dependent DNA methyltransferase n=1 Tax=Pseudonocardia sp. HH130630-07 TaxID=1690815 RepID=UPI0008153CF9|nr:class I SAM-dependent methyltransferase [Pseudonocardia sp. HH130630-07]ANY10482.1 methyltransferase type 11 [Pseudonocardia sp. HH130630-07]